MNENENKGRIRGASMVGIVFTLVAYAATTPELFAQQPTPAPSSPTLLVQADLDCSFALDDGNSETLKAGPFKRISIPLGEHVVTAVSLDGKDRWRTVVNADKPLQKVVLIELQKVRAAREKDEKEAVQLEHDIKEKKSQADKLRAETVKATALQAEINNRKSEIQDQVAGLQKQIQQEQAAAQEDDANTQQARSCVASEPKTTVGSLLAAGCNASAIESDNSARAHRANIAKLQNDIADLNRQLARPDAGSSTGSPRSSIQQSTGFGYAAPLTAKSLPAPGGRGFSGGRGGPEQQQSLAPIVPSGSNVSPNTEISAMADPVVLRLDHSYSRGITLATDADCIVGIDGKLVGRVQKDHKGFFPTVQGKHTLSVATKAGDYWDKSVEIAEMTNLSVVISFQKLLADRAEPEQDTSGLRNLGDEKQRDLAGIEKKNELASRELQSTRRRSIVEVVDYFFDRWGKELGMARTQNDKSGAIDNTLSTQGIQNLGNTDTTSQTATNLVMGIEILMSNHSKAKAHINELAAQAAERRIDYLGKALEEPLKYRPDIEALGYAATSHAVTRDKREGKLIIARDFIEYRDSLGAERISCSSLKNASEGNQIHLQYSVAQAADHKTQRKSLDVRAIPESDQDALMGNVYLACPQLTQ